MTSATLRYFILYLFYPLYNIYKYYMNKEQQLNLSLMSCGTVIESWEKKPLKPILSKIIKRDVGDFAVILTEDPSKPLRFLYLSLLTDKNRNEYLRTLILKIERMMREKVSIQFQDMSLQMKQLGNNFDKILKNLKILQHKMHKQKDDQLIILKFCEDRSIIDPLLVLSFRAIAYSNEFRIRGALNCETPLSLTNTYEILRKFGINKSEKNELNRFVLFYDLKEIDLNFFINQGISMETQLENCQQLFDAYKQKYSEEIILEQMYCQL